MLVWLKCSQLSNNFTIYTYINCFSLQSKFQTNNYLNHSQIAILQFKLHCTYPVSVFRQQRVRVFLAIWRLSRPRKSRHRQRVSEHQNLTRQQVPGNPEDSAHAFRRRCERRRSQPNLDSLRSTVCGGVLKQNLHSLSAQQSVMSVLNCLDIKLKRKQQQGWIEWVRKYKYYSNWTSFGMHINIIKMGD